MCRFVPTAYSCTPVTDGISTLDNLIEITGLRVVIWVIGIVTCLGNSFVMFCRIWFKEEKNVHSLFIKNLAVADFMMGIYLLIIATNDVILHGSYNTFAHAWTTSWACKVTGIIGMTSLEVSILILTTMSVTCCITVTLPQLPHHITMRRATVILACVWVIGIFLAVLPISSTRLFGDFYSGNGVCLPLHIHDRYAGGWQYSVLVFLGLNLFAMLVIVGCYFRICCCVLTTSARANNPGVESQDRAVAMRFFVIVLTNLVCWIPISVVKILVFTNYKIPDHLYAWLSILVLPVNSSLNPIIYSVTTPSFRRKLLERFSGRFRIAQIFPEMIRRISVFLPRRHSSKTSTTTISLYVSTDGVVRDPENNQTVSRGGRGDSSINIPMSTFKTHKNSLTPLMNSELSCGSPIDGNEPHSNNNEPDLVSQLPTFENEPLNVVQIADDI